MKVPGLRSTYEKVGGIVYFERMLDKIRCTLPAGCRKVTILARRTWFDARCARFLAVEYEALVQRVLRGGTDEEILAWCFEHGRWPSEEDDFM